MLLKQHHETIYQSSDASRRWLRLFVVVLGVLVIWSMQTELPSKPNQQVVVNDSLIVESQNLALAAPQLLSLIHI